MKPRHRTGGGTGTRAAGPSPATQQCGHGSRGIASAITQVKKSEPQRDDAADRIGVVAPLITPLLVGRVRSGPVEFRAHPVLGVKVVEIPVTCPLPDPGLPPSRGQPVRAFHPADVTVFQHRQGTAIGVTERDRHLPAPAHLLTFPHGETDPVRSGTPAPYGPADPHVGVIKCLCRLDKVEHRVLDPGARREHRGVPGPQDQIRTMDDDAWDLRLSRVPGRRHRNADDRARLVDQAVPFGRCVVAQNSIRADPEQSGPQNRLPGGLPRKGCVHTSLKALPSADVHLAAHRARTDAATRALPPGKGITLNDQQLLGRRRQLG